MPELPEVETIRRGLTELIVGHTIKTIEQRDSKIMAVDNRIITSVVEGAHITGIRRRAKVLIIDLSSGYSFVIHLKMTGQLVYRGEHNFGAGHPNDSLVGELPDRSTRVVFLFTNGSHLYFNDQRRFGWIKLITTQDVAKIDFIQKLGPEPLDHAFTRDVLRTQLARRKKSLIKAALLDQTVVAGIGNIYADESLYLAKIHPQSRVGAVPSRTLGRLHLAIKEVLQLSIEKGGSTDKNYVNAEGKRGSYIDFAQVFRKEGTRCPRCGTIITKIRVAGRGTHVCTTCQKIYNKSTQ